MIHTNDTMDSMKLLEKHFDGEYIERLKMNILLTILLYSLITLSASAAENKTPPEGTWTGTIGTYKINACFQSYNASYYYLKHLEPIRLDKNDKGAWVEPDSQEWVFDTVTGTTASGTWFNRKKNSSLPIRLRLLSSDESYCGSDSYNDPIEKLPPVSVDTVTLSGDRRYLSYTIERGNTTLGWFEVLSSKPSTQKINEKLNGTFPKTTVKPSEFYSCRRGTLEAFGSTESESYDVSAPHLWSDRYLEVVNHSSGFCGGAHDYSESSYTLFDLSNAEVIDFGLILDWIDSDQLRQLIWSKVDSTEDCASLIAENSIYHLRLDSAGLVFSQEFGHCCRNCNTDHQVTLDEITPLCNEEGKKFLTDFYSRITKKKK